MTRIEYKSYSVDPYAIERINNNPYLTDKEKRDRVKSLQRRARFYTVGSFIWSIVSLVLCGVILVAVLTVINWIASFFSNL